MSREWGRSQGARPRPLAPGPPSPSIPSAKRGTETGHRCGEDHVDVGKEVRTAPDGDAELVGRLQGEGTPVLFIQGTGLHGDGWLPQVEDLRTHHACLRFDNRGMGGSAPGTARVTMETMARDGLRMMDAVGWRAAHVVGHSLGGCIALEMALREPARVRSLSLLCTAADGRGLTRMNADMVWRGIRMNVGSRRSRRRAFLELVLSRSQRASADLDRVALDLAPLFGHDLAETPPVVFRQVGAMRTWTASDRLHALAGIPTLVVGAEEDRIARPALVRALAQGIPGATHVGLPGAAHGVPMTDAGVINPLLKRHWAAVDAR